MTLLTPNRRRAEIAEGEHDGVGLDRLPARQPHLLAAIGRLDRRRFAGDELEPVAGRGHELGHIVAEQHARRIIVGRAAARAEPAGEMLGIVGPDAHPLGGDVEQMLGPAGAVGGAARRLALALDQGDLPGALAQQMQGLQRARRARADDRDPSPYRRGRIGSTVST